MKKSQRFIRKTHHHILLMALFISAGTSTGFAAKTNSEILVPNEATESTQQQKKITITGLLTDENGDPIIGASVLEKGTKNGVISNLDGRYTITVPSNAVLIFSYIGYSNEEKAVKNETTINLRMSVSSVGLEDVVVVGYGQQKKSSVVASINSIEGAKLSFPSRSLTNNIAGQIAGVMAVQRTGEPGRDDAQFWIRGISSFAGGTNPLVLVDGVPRKMNDIGVDEIETFTVLKDAAATAVYGSEGANGVVLITSKRGKVQKASIDFRAEYSRVSPTRLPDLMDSYNYLNMYNEAVWNDAGNPISGFNKPYADDILQKYRDGVDPDLYPNVNWMDMMNKHTQNSRYTLNLRGGTERVRYFVSGAYYQENGIFDSKALDNYDANIGLKRYNLRTNIDIDVTKTTLLSTDISGQYLTRQGPAVDTQKIFTTLSYFPTYLIPMRYSDGSFSQHPRYTSFNEERSNPYNLLNESGYKKTWSAALQTNVTLTQKLDFITPGLYIKGNVSFDATYTAGTVRSKRPKMVYASRRDENGNLVYEVKDNGAPDLSNPSTYDGSSSGQKNIYAEASLNYKRTFAEVHDVTAMVLAMGKETQYQNADLPYRKQSYVARATYGYDNRYMVEGSFGLTGSENFAKGYRYGIFPAFGLAWYASNEAFMKDMQNIINKLKFRFTYGKTGNDQVGGARFPYRGSLKTDASGYNFGFTPGANGGGTNNPGSGIVENTFASPALSWENEYKMNLGIDLGLLSGRIDLMFDIFKNRREGILFQRRTVSQVTGFRSFPFQNFGIMENKGFDGSIAIKHNIGALAISARGNITLAKNKVVEYDEVPQLYQYQSITGRQLNKPSILLVDRLYKDDDFNITVDPNTGAKSYTLKEGLANQAGVMPGDIKYKDLNNDGKIDSYDYTRDHKYFSESPELVYGFGLDLQYKGFYASCFFQGVGRVSMTLNGGYFIPFSGGLDESSARMQALSHWKADDPDNQNVLYPRLHSSRNTNNANASEWWYRNGSFLRLKNVEFGYQFNSKLISKLSMKALRLYVQGTNIALWDHVKYWDPEMGSGYSGSVYPITGTWTMGLEVTF